MLKLRRRAAQFLAFILVLTGAVVPATAAQADSWPFVGCWQYTTETSFAYYYAPGNYNVYANGWQDYSVDNYGSDCFDINVEDGPTTGHITVRVQFCPKPPPAIQFTCYVTAWGTTPASGVGVAAHDYHYPGGGCCVSFYYRMETKGYELFYRWV